MTTTVAPPGDDTTAAPPAQRTDRTVLAVAAAAATVVFAIRAIIHLSTPGTVGVDHGNWLTLGWAMLGDGHISGADTVYPPVVPLVVLATVSVFGVTAGTALVSTAAAVAAGAGVWGIARLTGHPLAGVAAGLLVAGGVAAGEAAGWGGIPQLLGLGLAPLVVWAASGFVTHPSQHSALVLGGLALASGATSHLIFTLTVAAALVAGAVAAVAVRRVPDWRLVVIAAAPPMLLTPLYLAMTVVAGSVNARADGLPNLPGRVFDRIGWDLPWLWLALVVVALFTLGARADLHSRLWQTSVGLSTAAFGAVLFVDESRMQYLVPTAVAVTLLLWADQPPRRRETALALAGVAGVAAVAVTWSGLASYDTQTARYARFAPPGTLDALEWVADHSPPDAVFAAPPVDTAPFGWWVEGVGRRPTWVGSAARWLNFPVERDRAGAAVELFTDPAFPDPAVFERAEPLGVTHLFIPLAWGGAPVERIDRFVDSTAAEAVFTNNAVVIVALEGTP